jgi:hypothetical protein
MSHFNHLAVETGKVQFSGVSEVSTTLSGLHKRIPKITLTCEDGNFNPFVLSLTTFSLTIGLSSPFTGIVHYHAISTL